MITNTPWGKPVCVDVIADGVAHIGFIRGGGLMFSQEAAEKHLTSHARECGELADGFLLFRENESYRVPILDAKHLRDSFKKEYKNLQEFDSEEELEQYLVNELVEQNIEYLEAAGYKPDPEFVDRMNLRREFYKAVEERSPNVACGCDGDHVTLLPGIVIIYAGDDSQHLVTRESHETMCGNQLTSITRPLAALEIVDERQYPAYERRLEGYGKALAETYGRMVDENGELARREKLGPKAWGPRCRFNHMLNEAIAKIEEYAREKGIPDITAIVRDQLIAIRGTAHPELRGAYAFTKYLNGMGASLGEQLQAQAEEPEELANDEASQAFSFSENDNAAPSLG